MKIRKGKIKTNEKDYNYGGEFESYVYSKEVSNDVKSSLIEGEKLSNKFRNRGLTRDKRATVNTVLDNRTLLILKKLKDNLLNEIYGVVSSGKEAYVFNSHKYLSEEELRGVKELLLGRKHGGCDDQHSDDQHSDDQLSDDQHSDGQNGHDQHSDHQHSDGQNGHDQHSDHQHSDDRHSDDQHSDDQQDAGLPDVGDAHESLYKVYHLSRHFDEVGKEKREEWEEAQGAMGAEEYEAEEHKAAEEDGDPNVRGVLDETYDIIDKMNEMAAEGDNHNWDPFQNKKVAISFATKVYNTSVLVFKKRSQYIEGEFRFRNAYTKNTNPRKMVKQWSEKEFRNLRRILICGLRCPYPLVLKSNVIVMSMLGSLDTACPKMKDLILSPLKWKELYIECICILRQLFCSCKLVHADFSEYNLLYFYNHIYIIDVSQSMEHDHPYSLEFLKRDCVNITNFFKKKIGTLQNDMQESVGQLNGMLQGAKIHEEVTLKSRCGISREGEEDASDNKNGVNYTNCENGHTQKNSENPRDSKSSEPFYSHVQILPLKKLFDYIVSSSLPQDVTYFLERDKKEIHMDPSEITYLQIFGLIKNTTPIPKLNLRNIKKNRTYFEKLKRATGYYVTKYFAKNQSHIKKHADKSQVEEQIFLSSWIPSHLNEIKDIKTIEKDLKLLKKGKSMVSNFISNNHHTERSKHAPKNNTFVEHNNLEGEKHSDAATEEKNRRTNGDCTLHAEKEEMAEGFTRTYTQKENLNDDDNGGDPYEQVKETHKNGERGVLDGLSDKGSPKSIEKVEPSKNLLDEHKSDAANDENNFLNSEQEEEVKFKGIIPEGVTRKEWSKLVKEQNREKRKHKIPKYQKKKKKKKAHLKKK
ncbi:serine/threonine protein kinase RIO1, putative [Plasmodium knowlesi strain H]|uniref:non-specific serine/threonine protein kinase n=3 Tax=Plasmodium knowlesi TaxID=5850 RepID=A0A5K1VP59_PLAKH|nr:serine/threonine protein kinase RIO1, putative [Plasmodium knowlesi strain H]OTN63775.1 putative Protease [Plasmodium knowlesi]CAA9991098.1 serine/threonine protein kinase RIO1, putative [Plasmodium knowlesi strain H]SBO20600.1 serine/threonine protein kinase RIO1, putative [Plasmodium knowlesi strain H]SBO21000.1 serine/threonine protein kinase RIO1, putative [Plasmodium knowlesi strain H]VVS80572.1 serine/threonine protein kinase RIO1, putative [Plasmodium knowlesi strain H]|eukprot:XP_002262381.1 protease, putative [Plasmodium knowlesi strain H]